MFPKSSAYTEYAAAVGRKNVRLLIGVPMTLLWENQCCWDGVGSSSSMGMVVVGEGAPQGTAQGRAGSRVVSALAPGTSLGPYQDVGLCMGTGRTAPWGGGDRPCCGFIVAGSDEWWMGWHGALGCGQGQQGLLVPLGLAITATIKGSLTCSPRLRLEQVWADQKGEISMWKRHMETMKDEGETDKHKEDSWVRMTKMGKWESKLETELGPWHNCWTGRTGLAQPVHVSLQKNRKK